MAKWNDEFASWLKINYPQYFEAYVKTFQTGRDVFSLLGESYFETEITPKDLVARFVSETQFNDNKFDPNLMEMYHTPVQSDKIGYMRRTSELGINLEKDAPNYLEVKNHLASSYRVKILDDPKLNGVIDYRISKWKSMIKSWKYKRMLKRATKLALRGKQFSIKNLDMHTIGKKIKVDNSFHHSLRGSYRIGNNEKLLNVVNAFARNLTEVFFDHKGKHWIDVNTDRLIKGTTSLLATMFVSRAMDWGDIRINQHIEESLKAQVAQHIAALPEKQGNLALKKIREEVLEVTKYMMHRQKLTVNDFVSKSELMGIKFKTKPNKLEEALFGIKDFALTKETEKKKEAKTEPKKQPETEAKKQVSGKIKIKRMDLIREISKQIDEMIDNQEGRFYSENDMFASNTGWYFNAYQSVINKAPNSSYQPIEKVSDFKTNCEILDVRQKLLQSLAQSVVQVGGKKQIEFNDKQLAELHGENIAQEMLNVVLSNFDGKPIEVDVACVERKTKDNMTAYNQMISDACNKVFEGKLKKTIKEWVSEVVLKKKEEVLEKQTEKTPEILKEIQRAGIKIEK